MDKDRTNNCPIKHLILIIQPFLLSNLYNLDTSSESLPASQASAGAGFASSFSISDASDSGFVVGAQRFTTVPSRATRNFSKFHFLSQRR